MKNKLVIWGTNAQEEKVLIAAELHTKTNKVILYTFPESIVQGEFEDKMMKEWREGQAVEFPEGYATFEKELSIAESFLPETLKVERPDIITLAQREWNFAVLAEKLNEAYQAELQDLRERINALTSYDNGSWDKLKKFWEKVQNQVQERNLWREHADQLRDSINELFNRLKVLREQANQEFATASQKFHDELWEALNKIEQKIETGNARLNVIFDELKVLQNRYREGKMTNEHRNKLWERLDGLFKKAKEKRFGPHSNEGSLIDRLNHRLKGLQEAIAKMEHLIRRDEDDQEYQNKRIAATEGQLEIQIRQAKIKLVQERVQSRKSKLSEMRQTERDVIRQLEQAKEREARRAEKENERQKYAQAKEKIKEEIQAKAQQAASPPEGPASESIFESAGTLLSEVLEDAIDSVKAVAQVIGEKAEAAMEKAEATAGQVMDAIKEKVETVADAVEEKIETTADNLEDAAKAAADKIDNLNEAAADKLENSAEVAAEKSDNITDEDEKDKAS